MEINLKVKKGLRIRAFQLAFIVIGIQIGVGILDMPHYIFQDAKQDAWISIIIAYLYTLFIVWTMFMILNQYENADIFSIQVDVFGKWIGKFLGTCYLIFFTAELLTILLSYTEIVQIFLLPSMPSFIMGLLLMILVIFSVLGGIRVVVGVCFLLTIMSLWVFVLLYDPISRMETDHFLPLFEASVTDLFKGAKTTSYTFLGLEILFIVYPFIDNKKKAKLPVYIGLSFSAFIVLVTTIISIGYYSPNSFHLISWPVLSLFKSVSFSFMERFDYFIIVEWMMVIIPVMVLLMWAITYSTKRLYAIPQKKTLYCIAALLLFISLFINDHYQIKHFVRIVSNIGFWIVFVYPVILLPIVLIKKKRQRMKGDAA